MACCCGEAREALGTADQIPGGSLVTALFDEWTGKRELPHLGSNAGAAELPFQSWHRFKEAFPPELVRRAIDESPVPVNKSLDPFGGSGTTALASQFLGVDPTTIEVNPFLADLIKAKLARYDIQTLTRAFSEIRKRSRRADADAASIFRASPKTFVEPGVDGRWVFDLGVAERIARLRVAIHATRDATHRRFFRVLLGGILVDLSNVVVSGKGRRYRRAWNVRSVEPAEVDAPFLDQVSTAIADVHRFERRPRTRSTVIHGDSRSTYSRRKHSIAVFSPPYPNSFDYTDVYNVELWTLGYLRTASDNQALRRATLTSHVQINRRFPAQPHGSPTLDSTLKRLSAQAETLWNPWIPAMVGGYFADMRRVLSGVKRSLVERATCWMVVGDSRYAGVSVPTAQILTELAFIDGWDVWAVEPIRSMRTSAQQGSMNNLAETLVVLQNRSDPADAS